MSEDEKVAWLSALAVIWGLVPFFLTLMSIDPDTGHEVIDFLSNVALVSTLTYLLIFSWRWAYLSGRNTR